MFGGDEELASSRRNTTRNAITAQIDGWHAAPINVLISKNWESAEEWRRRIAGNNVLAATVDYITMNGAT